MADMAKMSKAELEQAISTIALRLSSRAWVKSVSKHWHGANLVRLSRLKLELSRRA